ncbi:coiled-coil domain-containing protein 24 [Stegastes partitus]|uniref:Coiled-coil domain-containing protein 24 n=1 Tax=Stegastes partitus TaxID=144197 RepID=A0A9Y4K1E5_9TELE|nr:PREDICTED: coiled-coil domain-containing protein 24 [Stegastes partitus]
MHSPDGDQLWGPRKSLWGLIAERVSESELPKIHRALGHSLVDMYVEVHAEAEMWHKIWQKSQQGGNDGGGAGTTFTRLQGFPLTDPPAVKELLRAEVKMLLQTLREQAGRWGKDGEELLSQYKPETVNYVLSLPDSCYRRCTDPKDTEGGSRPSSRCSVQSSAEDEIEAMMEKLNVTEITQVVDRLRFRANGLNVTIGKIKQKLQSRSEFGEAEPSLVELRELRGALQTKLQLFPSSSAASSPRPVKEVKSSYRLSAGQGAEAPPASVWRQHHLPPLCPPRPRPPAGPALTKTSTSRTHSQHRITSASDKSSKAPACVRTDPSECTDSLLHADIDHSSSPERGSAGLHHRTHTSSFQTPSSKTPPSSHRSLHSPSTESSESPQRERKSSSARRSGSISVTPSPAPGLSRVSDAGSLSSRSDHSASTGSCRRRSGPQSGRCGGGSGPASAQVDNDRGVKTSGGSEAGSPARHSRRKSSSGMDNDKNGLLRKQSPSSLRLTDSSSRGPEGRDRTGRAACTQFTSPKKPHEGTTSQPKRVQDAQMEVQFLSRFHQPTPPAGVSHGQDMGVYSTGRTQKVCDREVF